MLNTSLAGGRAQVKAAQGKFEERLWSIVRGFLEVSRSDPDLLVTALQASVAGWLGGQAGGRGARGSGVQGRRLCRVVRCRDLQWRFDPLLENPLLNRGRHDKAGPRLASSEWTTVPCETWLAHPQGA